MSLGKNNSRNGNFSQSHDNAHFESCAHIQMVILMAHYSLKIHEGRFCINVDIKRFEVRDHSLYNSSTDIPSTQKI